MATQVQPVLSDSDLNDTDREILKLLRDGRVTPPYVSERLDKSREYASERLIRFNEHGHTDRPAPGLYELIDDPRDDVEPTPRERLDTLQAKLDDIREERDQLADDLEEARGEINALAEEIETLQDQLAAAPDREEIEAAIEDLKAAREQGDRNGVDVALDRLREAAMIDDGE